MKLLVPACCLAIILIAGPARSGEYDLTIPEAEKSWWELGGYVEARYYGRLTRSGSDLGRLKLRRDDSEVEHDGRVEAQIRGAIGPDRAKFKFLTDHMYQDTIQDSGFDNKIYEGYFALRPGNTLALDLGKKVRLWGKGYAWNPVGFISRPKNPDEPELNLEGYLGLEAEYVKSLSGGGLSNFALTVVMLPVFDWENTPLGRAGDIDLAAKAYFLLYDTDIDFIFFHGPNRPTGLGLDFSRNLKENLEIHGELALDLDAEKKTIGPDGGLVSQTENQVSFLVGLRYLTASETTLIAEYYRNGRGYSRDEADDFYDLIDRAWGQYDATGNSAALDQAENISRTLFSQKNYGRNYFYFRAIQKEPLNILYSSAWLTTIVNLDDFSLSLSPGASYMLTDNLELNARAIIPLGGAGTEFGEKLDAGRVEVYVRYYF